MLESGIMHIHQDDNPSTYKIKRYEPGKIWINDACYEHSVIVSAQQFIPWTPSTLSEVTLEDFQALFSQPPNILLLGTGENALIPDAPLLAALHQKGINVEFMTSLSACYTFTILTAEGRDVCACILIK